MDIQTGFQTGSNYHRLLSDDFNDACPHRVKHRRNH